MKDGLPLFADSGIVSAFVQKLRVAAEKNCCLVLVYCFMPEHFHVILQGKATSADAWRAAVDFKQLTGFWLARRGHAARWQKDFYDHVIRGDEDLVAQIRYVANNPVRRCLVEEWQSYPYTGAIGIDLCAVTDGLATL